MNAEIRAYASALAEVNKEFRKLLEGLPAAALAWTPLGQKPDSLDIEPAHMTGYASLAGLITHLCGSQTMWIHQALTGAEAKQGVEQRVETELQSQASNAELLALIDRVDAESRRILGAVPPAEMDTVVVVGRGRFRMSKRECIVHALEHLYHHLGVMHLTAQLWKSRHRAEK